MKLDDILKTAENDIQKIYANSYLDTHISNSKILISDLCRNFDPENIRLTMHRSLLLSPADMYRTLGTLTILRDWGAEVIKISIVSHLNDKTLDTQLIKNGITIYVNEYTDEVQSKINTSSNQHHPKLVSNLSADTPDRARVVIDEYMFVVNTRTDGTCVLVWNDLKTSTWM